MTGRVAMERGLTEALERGLAAVEGGAAPVQAVASSTTPMPMMARAASF